MVPRESCCDESTQNSMVRDPAAVWVLGTPGVSRFMKQHAYTWAGHLCVALGVVGAFLPVMPTVVFMILAAACYAKGNPALRRRLLAHPTFGPPIKDWEEERAISLRGKVLGIVMVIAGFTSSAFLVVDGGWLRIALLVLGGAIAVILLAVKTKR